MAIRMSSGLKNSVLGVTNLVNAFAYGVIHIYSGSQPASADLEPTGSLLGRITNNGSTFTHGNQTGGLLLNAVPSVVLVNQNPLQEWRLVATATGEAGWWRFKANAPEDTDEDSSTLIRLDGSIGPPYDEMYLTNTSLVAGNVQMVQFFQIAFASEVT